MPHLTNSDGTLVLLTLAGDSAAYDELFRRHEKRVLAAAYSVIHNAHIAEDATQDAFLAAWLKLDRLREPEKFGTWIARIAKNCAFNMALRFRNYLSLDDVGTLEFPHTEDSDPERMLLTGEEAAFVRRGLRRLPERSQQVIYLHYYEDMSAKDIARLMGISVGTVKSQLYDGRKKMRKELCSMDEKLNDTILEKLHKKIKEVKNWQYKNSKKGFEEVYRDVLKDIDSMPECRDKYHALADVLIRGYWWLPGEKNDKLLQRVKEAAKLGKNDEVMSQVLAKEALKYWGEDQRKHIRNVQIPSLDPADFRLTLADRWCALGYSTELKDLRDALEAFDHALGLLTPSDFLYYHVLETKKGFEESAKKEFIDDIQNRNNSGSVHEIILSEELKSAPSQSRYYGFGKLYSHNLTAESILENLFQCDGQMTAPIRPGESVTASDGSTLAFEKEDETVTVPAGTFSGCQIWTSRSRTATIRSWLKDGVGMIRQEVISEGIGEARVLTACQICGGRGLLPLCEGNAWEYEVDCNPEAFAAPTKLEVAYCREGRAILTLKIRSHRIKYDENSWLDMILKTRADYNLRGSEEERLQDVRPYARRAVELARTPCERAHAETAYSVVQRIIETDPNCNPDGKAVGLWNFFNRYPVKWEDGRLHLCEVSGRYRFEWKNYDGTSLGSRLLSNHIYSILNDVAGCLFDEKWQPGYRAEETRDYYGTSSLKVRINCEEAGTVTVRAGSFAHCLSVDTYCDGMMESHAYRGGRRTYYFAPGVGLVKVEIYGRTGSASAYELTSYEGVGEGYLPVEEGMKRRFEDLGLTDGYEGAVEYTYARDCEGTLVIFADAIGIRHKPPRITRYDSTMGELEENRLAETGKYDEANLEGSCNAIAILLHQLTKGYHHFQDPLTRAKRYLYNLRLMEAAGNGEIAPAFYARAARTGLLAAVALIGGGEREKGYRYLELALDYAEKWKAIPAGAKVPFGDQAVFGGILYLKGQSMIELPDGTRREIDGDGTIDGWLSDSGMIYYAMTAPGGWEWFDPAREDERYLELTERAKKLTE